MNDPVCAIFVYGTLRRGECRETCWPHPPIRVEPATVRGRLYDLGPYPAMVDGGDLVLGELWHLRREHVAETLAVLDEVEDAATGEAGLYVRRVVTCQTEKGTRSAYAYYFARPETIAHLPPVAADATGRRLWRANNPRTASDDR